MDDPNQNSMPWAALVDLYLGAMSPDELRARLGVSLRSWQRWRAAGEIPKVQYLAACAVCGVLVVGEFAGWRVLNNRLVAPDDRFSFSTGELFQASMYRAAALANRPERPERITGKSRKRPCRLTLVRR